MTCDLRIVDPWFGITIITEYGVIVTWLSTQMIKNFKAQFRWSDLKSRDLVDIMMIKLLDYTITIYYVWMDFK